MFYLDDFSVALSQSARDFLDYVYPKIKHEKWLGEGELIPVEAVTENKMAILLDQYAGIDAWYIRKKVGIRGLASRVQYNYTCNTFTIRKSRESGVRTEFDKLRYAIEKQWIHPYWFSQAYISPTKPQKKLYSVALCKTFDLIRYIQQEQKGYDKDYYVQSVDRCGAATFYVVPWSRFEKKGYFFKKFIAPNKQDNFTILNHIEKSEEISS